MASDLVALTFDALDPDRLVQFWAGVLDWTISDDPADGIELLPGDGTGFRLRVLPTHALKVMPNRTHLDLTSTTIEDQRQTVARALDLGAQHIDIGQTPDQGHVVLADPEGNEFCVIEPGNSFLAGCGFIGAISCDGSQEVGYFWSAALGWPLVWDQEQETAIQSPHGGTKITWGGPPVNPKPAKNRLHLDIAPPAGDIRAEADRLVALGATRINLGQSSAERVVLADPDGNEFCVVPAR